MLILEVQKELSMKEEFFTWNSGSHLVTLTTLLQLPFSIKFLIPTCLTIISVSIWSGRIKKEKRVKDGLLPTVSRVCLPNYKASFLSRIWVKTKKQLSWKPKKQLNKQTLSSAEIANMEVSFPAGRPSHLNKIIRNSLKYWKRKGHY